MHYHQRVIANIKANPWKWAGGAALVVIEEMFKHRALEWANRRADDGVRFVIPYIRDILGVAVAHPWYAAFVLVASYSIAMVAIAYISALRGPSAMQQAKHAIPVQSPDPPDAVLSDNLKDSEESTVKDNPAMQNTEDRKPDPEDTSTPKNTVTTGPVTIQPGGVASFGQQAGITAHKVTINEGPAPVSIKAFPVSANEPDATGIGYVSKVRIVLSAPIPRLTVFASAPSLTSMMVGNGGFIFVERGVTSEGAHFETVPSAFGEYIITLRSQKPERFHLQYRCEGVECL